MTIEQHRIILDPSLKPITELSRWDKVVTIDDVIGEIAKQADLSPEAEIESTRDITGKGAHKNFLSYLELCWAKHYTPVITPDIVWYTLLCEIALLVKADPERVRPLFSHTDEKQLILVPTGDAARLPLDLIIDQLKRLVPSDADVYLPTFTTSTYNSRLAFYAAFADAVSPYYNYGMYLCGFPSIIVRGSQGDWGSLPLLWQALPQLLFPDSLYRSRVQAGLIALSNSILREKPEFWADMFSLKNCGSGHQTEVRGWVRELFVKQPDVSYVRNYSSHASKVDYRNITTSKDFSLFAGLFSSDLTEEAVLEPYFGSFVIEKKPLARESSDATDAVVGAMQALKFIQTPVVAKNKRLSADWTVEEDQDLEMLNGLDE